MAGVSSLLLDLIAPRRCVFCGATGVDDSMTCAGCAGDLARNEPACPRCAAAFPGAQAPACADCQQRPPPFDAAVAPLRFVFPVDIAIRALKFHRRLHYVPALGAQIRTAVDRLPSRPDALLPVPLHWRRQWRRGFNQARELAVDAGRRLDLPVIEPLRRSRYTSPQTSASASHRRRNLRNAFRLVAPVAASHVAIVDDVITTGSTVSEVARCLAGAGVTTISVVAVARA